MRSNIVTRITAHLFIIFLILLFSNIAYAQDDIPMLPEYFYGQATVHSQDVPVNSVVIAKINGEKKGELTVTSVGDYGEQFKDNKLTVIGNRSDTGEEIEFFIKLPGMQEIKAEETFPWQSGLINDLDLTFTGEEVPVPATDDGDSGGSSSSSSGGGSSGGKASTGGGGGPAVTDSNSASFYHNTIEANKQIIISIKSPDIPFVRLQLIVNNDVEDVDFNFEVIDAPNNDLDDVYKYISITAPKIKESNVETAILRFKISNDWLEENNYNPKKVSLLRYHNGQWEELETVHEGADKTHNQYRAGTPGFSNFAIKAEKSETAKVKIPASSEKEEEITEEIEKEEQGESLITGLAVGDIKANPVVGISIVMVIVILGAGLILFFRDKKSGGKQK